MKDVKQRIVASLNSRSYGCDNYLLWAPPGSGKSFFIQEIAKSLGSPIHYRENNLAQMDEAQFRTALSEIERSDKPRLCLIDEIDSKPNESWPYEVLLPSLEPPAGRRTTRTCFVLAGSSGGSTSGMKEGIAKRPKGIDLLSRIPPGNEFEIEGLGLGDRLLVVSTQFLNAAREEGREIHEVEKLVLYYVALNPQLKSARNIRQLAVRSIERVPSGEDRIRYDHLFDPGDPENKEFWFRASSVRDELVNVFVALNESDRPSSTVSQSTPRKIITEVPPRKEVTDTGLEKNRIAVLPFTNFSPDPNDEYFADGMTDEIISTVSGIRGLSVISRTSVMKYKKTTKSMTDIGQELRAGKLLEGSIRKSGNRVRITVQLIDSENDAHLWAQSYDRNLDDIFETQMDIARKIADALKVPTAARDRNLDENVDAFTLCLRARSLWYRRTREANEQAILLFEDSLKIDSESARALAGIADCYVAAGGWGWMDQKEAYVKASQFAKRALELDDTLPEAHVALGQVKRMVEGDYHGAEVEFKRAVSLNPNYSDAHEMYAWICRAFGRLDEALREVKKAFDLDPVPAERAWLLAVSYFFLGRNDDAMAVCNKILQTQPEYSPPYLGRAVLYAIRGAREEAFKNLETYHRLTKQDPYGEIDYKCLKARIEAHLGNEEEAFRLIDELYPQIDRSEEVLSHSNASSTVTALNEASALQQLSYTLSLVGDGDRFFRLMDYLIDTENIWPGESRDPSYENMRSDPRFAELFRKDLLRLERRPSAENVSSLSKGI